MLNACSISNYHREMQQESTEVNFTLHNSKLHLGLDLCGETSDFNTLRNNPAFSDSETFCGPSEISRKKITASNALTFNEGCDDETEWDEISNTKSNCKTENMTKKSFSKSKKSLNDKQLDRLKQVKKENIQPDLLHAVPGTLFNKSSWDFLEACSPVYANNGQTDVINHKKCRRRHASEDNLTSISKDVPIFIHPTVHHPSLQDGLIKVQNQNPFLLDWKSSVFRSVDKSQTSIEVSSHLDALQIGDVFSFPSQLSQVRDVGHIGHDGRKTKQDQLNSWKSNKQAFAFSSLIPGFLKSFHGNSSRDLTPINTSRNNEYDHFQANYPVMEDYRQHFQSQPLNSFHSKSNERIEILESSEFWPTSFQALPFRSIPPQYTVDVKRGSDKNRKSDASHTRDPLTSPPQISRKTQMKKFTKLIDQDPSGLY